MGFAGHACAGRHRVFSPSLPPRASAPSARGMSPVGTISQEDTLRMLRLVAIEMNVELSDCDPSISGKLP